jgi:hypothetical protein
MSCITKKALEQTRAKLKLFLGGYYNIIIAFPGGFVNIKKAVF